SRAVCCANNRRPEIATTPFSSPTRKAKRYAVSRSTSSTRRATNGTFEPRHCQGSPGPGATDRQGTRPEGSQERSDEIRLSRSDARSQAQRRREDAGLGHGAGRPRRRTDRLTQERLTRVVVGPSKPMEASMAMSAREMDEREFGNL